MICGPYQAETQAPAVDANELAELKASLASLESRFDELSQTKNTDAVELEQKFEQKIEALRDQLSGKAPSIDMLEFEEKLKGLEASLASKAETTDMLGLQRDVLKLGLTATTPASPEAKAIPQATTSESRDDAAGQTREHSVSDREHPVSDQVPATRTAFPISAALIILALSLAAGFGGGWLQSRLARKNAEAWSVKTSGTQIVLSRLDAGNTAEVTMTLAEPLQSSGEQKFSSFADVKRYVDTLMAAQAASNKPVVSDTPQPVSEITIKPGDSLKKLALVVQRP